MSSEVFPLIKRRHFRGVRLGGAPGPERPAAGGHRAALPPPPREEQGREGALAREIASPALGVPTCGTKTAPRRGRGLHQTLVSEVMALRERKRTRVPTFGFRLAPGIPAVPAGGAVRGWSWQQQRDSDEGLVWAWAPAPVNLPPHCSHAASCTRSFQSRVSNVRVFY